MEKVSAGAMVKTITKTMTKNAVQILHERAKILRVKQPKWRILFEDSSAAIVSVSFIGYALSCSAPNKEIAKNKLADYLLGEKECQTKDT